MKTPLIVDVVILTYRPDERVGELIRRMGGQNYPIRHILLINTKSDYFSEELYRIPGVIVHEIPQEEFDHGGTRDLAFRLSDAQVLLFMTQDALPYDERLLEELLVPFVEDGRVGVSYARQIPYEGCDEVERYTRQFNYPETSRIKSREDLKEMGIKAFFCSDVCAAYRRDVYQKVGGFPQKAIFNEDMIFAANLLDQGGKVAYVAEAKVIHSHNYSGLQQFRRNFDMGVSQANHPEIFRKVSSEGEGIRLVKKTVRHLVSCGKIHLIIPFFYKTGCKFLGYQLGKRYQKLPGWLIRRCTGSRWYWMYKKELQEKIEENPKHK